MASPAGTPLPKPGGGTGPTSLKNTPQRAQSLVVVDVCRAQGCHHRCPRVPACGENRPCRRRSAHRHVAMFSPLHPPLLHLQLERLRPREVN